MTDTDLSPDAADPKNLASRRVALAAVTAVFRQGTALESGLASHPEHKRLAARDRAFARAIAATAVRRTGALEITLSAYLDRPLPETAIRARMVMRCAAAELLVLHNAPHAVVDGWVEVMDADPATQRYKGLANAVLRKLARYGQEIFDSCDPLADLPDWLGERWCRIYGEDTARAIARARGGNPPLDLTARPGTNLEALASAIEGQILPTGTVRRSTIGDVAALAGYDGGDWWAQDAAAALPVRLLRPAKGETIADLCAAPGGKTLQIAASGATTLAIDRSASRLERVRANLARTGLSATVIAADAGSWVPDTLLDGVLLDAPCSATGTLRRHPDVAWAKRLEDITSLATVQSRLLDAGFAMLKTGGRLIYCTCSLEPEEGEDQVSAFLARTPAACIDPVGESELPGLEHTIDPQGCVRTRPDLWPELGGLDGFYMARIVSR